MWVWKRHMNEEAYVGGCGQRLECYSKVTPSIFLLENFNHLVSIKLLYGEILSLRIDYLRIIVVIHELFAFALTSFYGFFSAELL